MAIPWHPLLEGSDAERAWAVIHDIADALRGPAAEMDDPGVGSGTAGLALFYAYLGAATGDGQWAAIANRLMEHSIDALSERSLPPELFDGFTGIAWTKHHLEGILFEASDENDPILDSLRQLLERPHGFQRGEFDFIGGLAGYGIYAFDALPRPAAKRSLELLAQRLIEIGEPVNGGFSWFSPPEALPDWQLEEAPNGKFNLGVSHGVAAVIAILGLCCGAGALSAEQRAIFDR
ncbi:MAG: lanthionine synthetase LanC family protein, partial [Thermoanaerobaculia bacterium]